MSSTQEQARLALPGDSSPWTRAQSITTGDQPQATVFCHLANSE